MAVPQMLTELDGAEWASEVDSVPPPEDCEDPDRWRALHPGGLQCVVTVLAGQTVPFHPHFAQDGHTACTQVLHVVQGVLEVRLDSGEVLPLWPGMWHGLEPGREHELSAPEGDMAANCSVVPVAGGSPHEPAREDGKQ